MLGQAVTQTQVEQAAADLMTAIHAFVASVNTKAGIGDLAIMASHYGETAESPDWDMLKMYDMDQNGKLDIVDLAALARKILGLGEEE
ncbi:Gellan lyase precursor [compost metagenome]